MGKNLAEEVNKIIMRLEVVEKVTRLSFIGHSMGGLIIRSALPFLIHHKHLMFSYISMATPHLGVSKSYLTIVGTGFGIMQKFAVSLKQLTLND